jgi:MAP3K TRAFs-binding domain
VGLLAQVEGDLGDLDAVETGVLVDLLLSYRAVSAYDRMVDLFHRLPVVLRRTVLVREQLGFALNRLKRRSEALDVLQHVLDEHGASSETLALMGRIHKDLWSEAKQHGDPLARNHLDSAIALYLRGFESDWRDAYPGINAVTLLDIRGDAPSETKKQELLPVVRFAVLQRVRASRSDYWDHATLLELAVLASDETATRRALGEALAAIREPWEARSTANNLTLIREARAARGVAEGWLGEAIAALESAGVPAAR